MENLCELLKQLSLKDKKAIHEMTFLDKKKEIKMRNHIANCSKCQQRATRIKTKGTVLMKMILDAHKLIK